MTRKNAENLNSNSSSRTENGDFSLTHRPVSADVIKDVQSFIDKFYVEALFMCESIGFSVYEEKAVARRPKSAKPITLDGMLKDMDKGFADTLFDYIDAKGVSDVDAYKLSNVDKKTFSKIKCNKNYRPSKITAISFAIGLHLNIREARHLLSTAGMCLSRSNKFDVIIEYFIITGKYKTINDVNDVLYEFDQSLLGVEE